MYCLDITSKHMNKIHMYCHEQAYYIAIKAAIHLKTITIEVLVFQFFTISLNHESFSDSKLCQSASFQPLALQDHVVSL
jgi:hypothetical protein